MTMLQTFCDDIDENEGDGSSGGGGGSGAIGPDFGSDFSNNPALVTRPNAVGDKGSSIDGSFA